MGADDAGRTRGSRRPLGGRALECVFPQRQMRGIDSDSCKLQLFSITMCYIQDADCHDEQGLDILRCYCAAYGADGRVKTTTKVSERRLRQNSTVHELTGDQY